MSFTASELKDISKNWAQERTLTELRDKMASNNSILAAIAKEKFNLDTATIRSFEDAIDDAKDGLTELQNSAEKAKRAQVNQLRHEQRMQGYEQEIKGNYKRSVDDLRSSLDKMSRFDSSRLYEGVTSGINSLSYNFRKADGSATGLSTAFTRLNHVVAVVAAGVGAFAGAMPAFQAMANTGVTFGGSLEKMQEMVGRTGLKLDEFQGIVGQFGTVIGGVGEENFAKLVRGVQDATRQFGAYGETDRQQAENLAFFLDLMRSGGSAYKMSADMQLKGAVAYTRELTALTELTGKEKKEIQSRQKAARDDVAIDLRLRQLRKTNPEQAAILGANLDRYSGALGKDMARTIVGMQMGIMPKDEQTRAFMSIGGMMPAMEELARGITTFDEKGAIAAIRNFQRTAEQSPGLGTFGLQAMAGGQFAGAAEIYRNILNDADRAEAAEQRQGGLGRILDIMTGRGGNLDRATTAGQQMTRDIARIQGDFKAALYASTQQLKIFQTVLEGIAGVTGMGTGVSGALYGLASAGTTGAFAALTAMAMPTIIATVMKGATLSRILGGGGLGLTSMLGSTGAGASLMRGASTMGGLGRGRMLGAGGLGVAGGLVGSYAANQVGAPGWLGGALGGAATGALAGIGAGPGGILAGALLGGLVGGITGYGTSSASAAEAKPGDQTGDASSVLQDSTALVEMQASSTSYVSAMAALVSRVAAQATMTSLAPPMAPQNDALLGAVTTLNSTVAAQTPYIQDQARQARITAGIIGDFG